MNQSTHPKGRLEDSVYISQGVAGEAEKQSSNGYRTTSLAEDNYSAKSEDYLSEPSDRCETEKNRSFAIGDDSFEAQEKEDISPKAATFKRKDDFILENFQEKKSSKKFQKVKTKTEPKLSPSKQNIKNHHPPHGSLVYGSLWYNKYLKGETVEIRTECEKYWNFVCREHIALIEEIAVIKEIDFIKERDFHKIIRHESILVVTFIKCFESIKKESVSWGAKQLFKRFTGIYLLGTPKEIKNSNYLGDEDIILYRLLADIQYYLKSTGPYPTKANYKHLITTASKILKYEW
jgi:hypothetical protein